MYFIITTLAAIITTAIWYIKDPEDKYKVSLLCWIFWGATLMWFVDHVIAYLQEGGQFFEVNLDATLLGICIITIALLTWEIVLLISDPKGVFKKVCKR